MILLILIISFIIFTSIILKYYPTVTLWDSTLISVIQKQLNIIPIWIPTMFDSKLYAAMIIIPLCIAWGYFFFKKRYFDIAFIGAVPPVTYGIGSILKTIIARPRPAIELQISVHPDSFSYVSNHTLITLCFYGMLIYYLFNFCENKIIRYTGLSVATIWVFSIGFSRIWLGVHNPTDILGAILLGIILLKIFINIREFSQKYIGL